MSEVNKIQDDKKNLLFSLNKLTTRELITLFIESKTASIENYDLLPDNWLETFKEMGEILDPK